MAHEVCGHAATNLATPGCLEVLIKAHPDGGLETIPLWDESLDPAQKASAMLTGVLGGQLHAPDHLDLADDWLFISMMDAAERQTRWEWIEENARALSEQLMTEVPKMLATLEAGEHVLIHRG